MVEPPKRPKQNQQPDSQKSNDHSQKSRGRNRQRNNPQSEIVEIMTKKIREELDTLKEYPIKDLVRHTAQLGEHLANCGLKTNQVRKFLDALNRIKVELAQELVQNQDKKLSPKIEWEVISLDYKLTYAAARQSEAKALSDVMKIAIQKFADTPHEKRDPADVRCLVTLLESTVAYHAHHKKN